MIESLESRTLCSGARHAHPVFTLDNGTLSVSGSIHSDVIEFGSLYVSGRQTTRYVLVLNGKREWFRFNRVERLVIYGGEGKDQITNTVLLASVDNGGAYLDGGSGNDNLYTSFGPDTLLGGGGNDILTRAEGNGKTQCYMDGGPGNDQMNYGTTMYGGSGYDTATLDPSAAADYIDYPFVGLTTTGGIEQYENSSPPAFGSFPNLSSRRGNLLLTYRPLGSEQSISAPVTRTDGKVAITVSIDYDNPTTLPADTQWQVRLDAGQTLQAKRNGLVLVLDRVDIGPISEREVLIPQP